MTSALENCVLLKSPAFFDPTRIARALALFHKTPLQDQVRSAKTSWGLISLSLDAAGAQELIGHLAEEGLEALSMPSSSLAAVPTVESLKKLELNGLPYDTLTLIAAAVVNKTTKTTVRKVEGGRTAAEQILNAGILMTTGLPIKLGKDKKIVEKVQEQSELLFYMDLLFKDPAKRFRIDALQFDYSFLKERKEYSVMNNFKLLLNDFVTLAPKAWHNRGTDILLQNKPIREMGYESLADLERETRWFLTLQSLPAF